MHGSVDLMISNIKLTLKGWTFSSLEMQHFFPLNCIPVIKDLTVTCICLENLGVAPDPKQQYFFLSLVVV